MMVNISYVNFLNILGVLLFLYLEFAKLVQITFIAWCWPNLFPPTLTKVLSLIFTTSYECFKALNFKSFFNPHLNVLTIFGHVLA